MTRALWPYVFGSHLGEQRVVVDDLKERILQVKIHELPYQTDLKQLQISETKVVLDLLSPKRKNLSGLYLVVGGSQIKGMVTQSNLLQAALTDQSKEKILSCCTPREQFVTVNDGDTVERALSLFKEHSFRRLPVLDEAGEITGILPRAVLLNWLTDQLLGK